MYLHCIVKTHFKSTVFVTTSLSLTPVPTASTRSTAVVPAADDPCVCSCPPMIVIDCDATTPTPAGKKLFFLKRHYDTKMQICSGTYRIQTYLFMVLLLTTHFRHGIAISKTWIIQATLILYGYDQSTLARSWRKVFSRPASHVTLTPVRPVTSTFPSTRTCGISPDIAMAT